MKKYVVRLTDEERTALGDLRRKGTAAARKILRANVLLLADADGPARTDVEIAAALGCHVHTVENLRRRCVLEGLEAALNRKPQERPSRMRKLDGAGEAHLIALACGEPPEGYGRWTMQLLATGLVELQVVESISGQTVWRTLKKTNFSRTAASIG